jgi:hypothetical protein
MDEYSNTIVGGRRSDSRTLQDYPHGIEVLLKKAKADPEFRDVFARDPLEAARAIELELSEGERAVLQHTPQATLATMVEKTEIPLRHLQTFRTARKAATLAAMVALTVAAPQPVVGTGVMEAPLDVETPDVVAVEQMYIICDALDLYREEHGRYLTTEEWEAAENPLADYLPDNALIDPWYRKYHYEAVEADGEVVNFMLESLGEDPDTEEDNIACPVKGEKHSFEQLRGGAEV